MQRLAFMEKMEALDPEFGDQVRGMGNMFMVDGALSAKAKALMALLGEALIRRDQGVKLVAGIARNLGATEAEIHETIRLAFLMGGLPALAAASAAYLEEGE